MENIIRVKALIVNDENEIMLGLYNGEYQFPGGHVEGKDIDLSEGLRRELLEETGIDFNTKNLKPFHKIHYDFTDKSLDIYYYFIHSNLKPNLDNVHYTEREKLGNFEIRYIKLDDVERILLNNIDSTGKNRFIVHEMIEALNIYKSSI